MNVTALPLRRTSPLQDALAQARRNVLFASQISDETTRKPLLGAAMKHIDRAAWLVCQGVRA